MNPTLTVTNNPFGLWPLGGDEAIAPGQLNNHWGGVFPCGHDLAVEEQESFPASTDVLGGRGFSPTCVDGHVDGSVDLDPGRAPSGVANPPELQMLDSCYTSSSRETDPSLAPRITTNSQPGTTTNGALKSPKHRPTMTEPSSAKKRGRPRKCRAPRAAPPAGVASDRDATIRSGRKASTKSDGHDSTSDDRRALRVREKNCIAANKCRSRRRIEEDNLKTKHEDMEREHHGLSGALSELMAERYLLKNMLMEHGSCDCRLIQDYLNESASEWVAKKLSESASSASSASSPSPSKPGLPG